MTKKSITFIGCCLIFCQIVIAQKNGFYLAPQIGLLNGNGQVSQMFGLTTGVTNKNWAFGIGASIDYYQFRSVPVFAELKRMFGEKKNTPFLYANAGVNIDWVLTNQHQHPQFWEWGNPIEDCKFSNGHFLDAGAGINIKTKQEKVVILSLGYSTKSLSESWTENIWNPVESKLVSTPRSNKYKLNRIVFKVGFRIF